MPAPFPDDDVDPAIRSWLSAMFDASARLGARDGLPVADRRAIAEKQREPWRSGGPVMASSETLAIGPHGLRLRIHRPAAASPSPVLLYLHGGGWTLFSIDTHDRLMREYAAASGMAVAGLDYRLAPEHPFPAALDDVGMALDWLQTEGADHGLDPCRFALGGDSAGANLALVAALDLRDRGGALPRALLLNYGAYDRAWHPSYQRYGDGERYMLTDPEMDAFWDTYLTGVQTDVRTGPPGIDPRIEPLHADLAGLPPAWLCIAQCDVLLDENLEMARRLTAAGNLAQAKVYKGATHSFLEATDSAAIAAKAIAEGAKWLTTQLA